MEAQREKGRYSENRRLIERKGGKEREREAD